MTHVRVIIAPPGKLGLTLKNVDGNAGVVICDILPHSSLRGSVQVGERLLYLNGKPLTTVDDVAGTASSTGGNTLGVQDNSNARDPSPTHTVVALPGKLGLRLNKHHLVLEVLSWSPLTGNVRARDRLVSINDVDVREVRSDEVVAMLAKNEKDPRNLGFEAPVSVQGKNESSPAKTLANKRRLPTNAAAQTLESNSCVTKRQRLEPSSTQTSPKESKKSPQVNDKRNKSPKALTKSMSPVTKSQPQKHFTNPPAKKAKSNSPENELQPSSSPKKMTPSEALKTSTGKRQLSEPITDSATEKSSATLEKHSKQPSKSSAANNPRATQTKPMRASPLRVQQPAQPPKTTFYPFTLADLPDPLRHLEVPTPIFQEDTFFQPGTRFDVKRAILMTYDLDQSIKKLESFLPQAEDCSLAHSLLSKLIETQRRTRDAVMALEKEKLSMFERGLRYLVYYKMIHGHLNVSEDTASTPLEHYFVIKWNSTYNLHHEMYREIDWSQHIPRNEQEENVKILDMFGFPWNIVTPIIDENADKNSANSSKDPSETLEESGKESRKILGQTRWGIILEKLKAYKEANGDCRVHHHYRDESGFALGNWVAQQRQDYKQDARGKGSTMNQNCIQELEALGFIWNAPSFPGKSVGTKPKTEETKAVKPKADESPNNNEMEDNSNPESNPRKIVLTSGNRIKAKVVVSEEERDSQRGAFVVSEDASTPRIDAIREMAPPIIEKEDNSKPKSNLGDIVLTNGNGYKVKEVESEEESDSERGACVVS
jgi:hypothetical protein